jgi:hypothetical protein
MDPALLAELCEYTRHLNKLRTEKNASLRGARDELARLTKQRENIIQAIKDGVPGHDIVSELFTRLLASQPRQGAFTAGRRRTATGPVNYRKSIISFTQSPR